MNAYLATAISNAKERLRVVRAARRWHQDECAKWDYESTNCDVCDSHDAEVERVYARLRKLIEKDKP